MMKALAAALVMLVGFSYMVVGEEEQGNYGVDVSFPMHHHWTSESTPLNPERKRIYEEFMEGCRKKYGSRGDRCDQTENDRIQMSLRQSQSMVNYTETGFMKIKAPEELRRLLTEHWEKNKDNRKSEDWGVGNIYVNHWASPTYMVSVEDKSLRGGGAQLKQQVWDAAKDTIQRWTGMELTPVSQYGIRVYTEGAILSPHVDRLPLVSSCIVNVAQDVDEPWPLEVYDRQGRAVNVTMEPGDMVLYESGSLLHGRPFPLKGRYFANIFIHFEPTGRKIYWRQDEEDDDVNADFPPYIIRGSPEEPNWRRRNPGGWKQPSPSAAHVDVPEGHAAAQRGDVERLAKIAMENDKLLHLKDRNGWQPIHEAARGGHTDAIELLLAHGADINARTHGGKGSSPLNVAISALSEKHPVSQFLIEMGALNIGPEL
jgi:hypothetical protein